ncbi:hypothetical protein L3Y34_006002 [Caenorhabditis briggsae]|uniref:Uncharacterized protein n=1 Tax=Caenorhabditis briggsae TaxID=6238 RepID=A0AAE9A2W2_CAEBR|nr:hypothetical protein L3Y34_006002 [Caenorhabditis briggsae]
MTHEADPGWQFLRQSPEQLLAATTKKFDSKKNVWVADPEEGFIAAEIKSSKGDTVVVVTSKGVEKTIKKDDAQQMNPPKYEKTEDMANLTFLNDASVLHNLRQRYYSMMIYTYSGLFCVVINPYKRLPIYSESVCQMYLGKRRNEMPPHLFAVSDEAYRNMTNDKENQSMLITGESGAGKTENTKKVISYFAMVGASQQSKKEKSKKDKAQVSLEDQIVQTNPVLEAFGNAKTVRNNNSSRFGKFIRIHFNQGGKVAGADIEHYLLEKSRVIKQAPGERSYHIFYQIYSDAVKGLREKLFLTRPIKEYTFVSQAEVTIDGVDDKEEMLITDEAFDIMKFTATEKSELFAITAGIMHMGELKFKQRPREEQAELEDGKEGELACKLYCVEAEKFVGALLKPRVKVGTEWVNKGQNLDQVNWAVGALAKALFARMFKWLITRCNKTLDAQDLSRDFFIGVLDIAGFEIFDLNSFEQLWINFVNEKLQQFFNHHMFVLEQEEYKREGIQWEFIDFGLDLQACIELIEKPLGIVSMLDEECIVPKATDLTLASKLNDQHLGKHPNFQKPRPPKGKQAEAHLAIVHYAGTVRYNVKGWLEKNKDPLNDTAVTVLKGNKGNQLMADLWADYSTQEDVAAAAKEGKKAVGKKKGKSASFMTVSMMYRESLNKLMHMLHQTHPHFIRCIIPNEMKKSGMIDANLVLNQLTCNGVLEGIRICRKGFPNRMPFLDFKQRYAVLAADAAKSGKDPKDAGEKISAALIKDGSLKPEEFQCGLTKVFFKAGVLAHLEELRDEALGKIMAKFQCACRHYLAQCEYKRKLDQKRQIKELLARIQELEEELDNERQSRSKAEKARNEMQLELEELGDRLDEAGGATQAQIELNKKREAELAKLRQDLEDAAINAETSMAALRKKHNDAVAELSDQLDTVQKMRESGEQTEAVKRENKALAQELKDIADQLGEGGKSVHDLQKLRRRLEIEKEELQQALDEAECALEAEEAKVMRAQIEVSQIRSEIEKRLQEKDEEFENTRKNHSRTIESMQVSLETESRGRAELLKTKKKLEGDVNELEIALDHSNKLNVDGQKSIKKLQDTIRELQLQVEEEQRSLNEVRDHANLAERRSQVLQQEKEDLAIIYEQSERSRRQAELELAEVKDSVNELSNSNSLLLATKRKVEGDLQHLQSEVEEALSDAKVSDDKAKKAIMDASKLADELRSEQEHASNLDKSKRALESQVKDLQMRLDEAEAAGIKGGKRQLAKLDMRIHELETELEGESRRHGETQKVLRNKDRKCRELQFQVDEDKKSTERMYDLIEKLQQKIKTYKRQIEDAESLASANLAKYRQLQHVVEDAQERADAAENALQKMRLKGRSASGVFGPRGLAHSMSTTGVASIRRGGSRGAFLDEDFAEE